MSKNSFYFSHDGNSRNNEKILAVRMGHGAEGYGVYFMILEKLLESSNYLLRKDYNVIAFDLRVKSTLIKSIVEDFGLFQFTEDGKYFYSESFNKRMEPLDNLRKQRVEAGKKSAEKRAVSKEILHQNSENERPLNDRCETDERPLAKNPTEKVKERKEKKEKKENDVDDVVTRTRTREASSASSSSSTDLFFGVNEELKACIELSIACGTPILFHQEFAFIDNGYYQLLKNMPNFKKAIATQRRPNETAEQTKNRMRNLLRMFFQEQASKVNKSWPDLDDFANHVMNFIKVKSKQGNPVRR